MVENFILSNKFNKVKPCNLHNIEINIVENFIIDSDKEKLRLLYYKNQNSLTLTSYENYNYLVDNGIIPWGLYLISSKINLNTKIYDIKKNCNIFVILDTYINEILENLLQHYNISHNSKMYLVDIYGLYKNNSNYSYYEINNEIVKKIKSKNNLVILLMMYIGFYKINLFGFDYSYKYSNFDEYTNILSYSVKIKKGNEYDIGNFYTNENYLLEIKDFEKIYKIYPFLDIESYSGGLFDAIFRNINHDKKNFSVVYNINSLKVVKQ